MIEYTPPNTTVQPNGTVCPDPVHITVGVHVGETAILLALACFFAVLALAWSQPRRRR